jgi:hypothetical protein
MGLVRSFCGFVFAVVLVMIAVPPSNALPPLAAWFQAAGWISASEFLSAPEATRIVGVYLVPALIFGLAFCLFGASAWSVAKSIVNRVGRVALVPDMPIASAIDYIVNDSRQELKQPPAPYIAELGPGAGRRITHKGVEHTDALRLIQEKTIAGDIAVWGHREEMPRKSERRPVFDGIVRQIPVSYWGSAYLDYVACFHETAQMAQTAYRKSALDVDDCRYTSLTLNRAQVMRLWRRKPFFRRWLNRRPRITFRDNPA